MNDAMGVAPLFLANSFIQHCLILEQLFSGMSLIRYRARHSAMLWVRVHLRRQSSGVWCEGGLDARFRLFLYPDVWKNKHRCFYCTAQILKMY